MDKYEAAYLQEIKYADGQERRAIAAESKLNALEAKCDRLRVDFNAVDETLESTLNQLGDALLEVDRLKAALEFIRDTDPEDMNAGNSAHITASEALQG